MTGQPSSPSSQPTAQPSDQPTGQPSALPSVYPSAQPSNQPSGQPTGLPSEQPSEEPSEQPLQPSKQPSGQPSSSQPSQMPTTDVDHTSLSSNNEADEFNIVVMSIVAGIIFVVTVVVTWALCKISRKKVGVLVAGAAYQDTDHELRSAEFELIAIKKQQARIVPSDDMDGDVEEVGDSLLLGV
jgi:hypothetical protein